MKNFGQNIRVVENLRHNMSSSRQIKMGVILSYLTLALSNIIALVYTPFMLRMMGQSEYGLYSLVASVVAYLTIMDFGFGNAIVRYTAKYRAELKQNEQYYLFGMFLAIYVIIGLIAFCLGLWLYNHTDLLFEQSMSVDELRKVRLMILLMVFNVAITFPLSIFPAIIMAYENFVFHKVVNLIRVFLQPCLMIPLLLLGYRAVGMVVLTTILNIGTLIIYCWYCFSHLRIRIFFSRFDISLLKEISIYSFYVFLTIIVDRAFWSTGQFILGILSGTKDVAIYSLVVQLCNYYMAFSLAISGVFLPKMTQLVSEGKSIQEISSLFVKIGRMQYIILGYILFGFILFGKDFIFYWAGSGYEKVYFLTVLLMVPQTIPLIQNTGISILQALNKQRFRSVLNVTVAVISVFVGYQLTLMYGIIGCAISTSIALLIGHGVILNWYYWKKIHLNIGDFWKQIICLSFPFLGACLLMVLVNMLLPSDEVLLVIGKMLLYTILCFAFLWHWGCNSFEKSQIIAPILKIKIKLGI